MSRTTVVYLRKEGRKEGRKEEGTEGRKDGGREGRKEGRRKEGGREGGREGRKEGRREGGREGRREGGREGRKKGRKELINFKVLNKRYSVSFLKTGKSMHLHVLHFGGHIFQSTSPFFVSSFLHVNQLLILIIGMLITLKYNSEGKNIPSLSLNLQHTNEKM
jgi:hypothetical protein